jgi:glycosyltransferase involved in cell wall biosynthesis
MKNLNVSAPINKTGYGVASLNIIKRLTKFYNISYFPMGSIDVENQENYDIVKSVYDKQYEFDYSANYFKIWHQFALADRIGNKKSNYNALSFFELDKLNEVEKHHINYVDQMFVTSNWAKEVLKNNDIKTKVKVAPLGVDMSVFDYKKYTKPKNDKYVFLNLGKWEVRKGHDILHKIFSDALPEQYAELWLMTAEHTNSYSSKEEIQKWHQLYNRPNIKIIPSVNSHEEVAQLISQADCCIFPSRAEGWNMELLESMAMNKPVIATNYSAHTEFCTKDNCFLIDVSETEPAHDGKVFQGQGNWAKLGPKQLDMCIDYMRYVLAQRITTNENGLETARKFSWENTANIIHKYIG